MALTDSLQAIVMLFAFIAVPSVLARNFVGWKDLDPYDYPRYVKNLQRDTIDLIGYFIEPLNILNNIFLIATAA